MNKKPLLKSIRDDLFYLLVLFFIKMLRLISRGASLNIMRILSRFVFVFARGPRQRVISHLTMVYGAEKDKREIITMARAVFNHFAIASADMLRIPNLIRDNVNTLVTTKGIEHLEKAFKSDKGMIFITCHFGNWEVLGAWLGQNGFPMKVVGTTVFDPRLDKILVETRKIAGNTNIARGKGTREIIRTIKKGDAVGMLIDQDTKAQSIFVNFFGKLTHTPTGPAVLARRLNVPIIPIFMYLNEELNYVLECQPQLELIRTEDEEYDVLVATQKISDTYEAMIRRYPEQWVWMHKRWKTQPKPEIQ